MSLPPLTDDDRAHYEWQMTTPGVGEEGQQRLKAATVLVSRCGGVGGAIAQHLAMAGVGRLVIAHAGNLRASDMNRQMLMRDDSIGQLRADLIARRLRELNPTIRIDTLDSNIGEANVDAFVAMADIVACAAPLFEERFAMNDACVRATDSFRVLDRGFAVTGSAAGGGIGGDAGLGGEDLADFGFDRVSDRAR